MKLFKKRFAGDKKVGQSFLHRYERLFIDWMVPKLPSWIETYHLTLLTIPISLAIVLFGYLGHHQLHWLWGSSLMIALQWVTDSLDGSLGRYRNTGLIKWGYYMDHLLDYFFLCAIVIGYILLFPPEFTLVQRMILAIFAGFMVNAYLSFAATNEFRITFMGIGPTEIRLVFIGVNTMLVIFGQTFLGAFLPYILGFSVFGLAVVVYHTQARLWGIDMANKNQTKPRQ